TARPLPVADALSHVIRAYHPTAKLPESLAELRALYLSVLHDQRALLLMDNARDETQVEPLIPPPNCLLLVTSRFHFTVPGLKVKNLDALRPADAVKLLLEIAPRIGDQAAEIARLCGNLPLGLRLAASVLATRLNFKVAEYVRKLADASERLKLIDASLSLSYELLREELQTNWRALAVFPDSFDQRAAAAVWELDDAQTQERLAELLTFSLVEWNESTDQYRLHDLARVFADSRATESERLTNQQRHAEHYLQVLLEADQLYLKGGEAINQGLALFDREWSNALAGWNWAKRHADTIPRALELCSEYPAWCTYIPDFRQHPRERIAWREVALSAARKLGNKDAQSWHLGNLGIAYWSLGEYQRAIEFHEQELAIEREIGNRNNEGKALNSLGNAYKDLGETQRAIEFYEQSTAICHEIGDHRSEGAALLNQGSAYWDLGDYQRAIEFYEQSLAICREIGDRGGEGHALCGLGIAYFKLDETSRAVEFYKQQLAITREIGDRRGEGIVLWNTALALDKLGERAQAIVYAQASLVIYEQIENPWVEDVRRQLEIWRSE
ncbi:MAG: tetratricopeptide repeat protein, partial [Acidobacteriota bacterium]